MLFGKNNKDNLTSEQVNHKNLELLANNKFTIKMFNLKALEDRKQIEQNNDFSAAIISDKGFVPMDKAKLHYYLEGIADNAHGKLVQLDENLHLLTAKNVDVDKQEPKVAKKEVKKPKSSAKTVKTRTQTRKAK